MRGEIGRRSNWAAELLLLQVNLRPFQVDLEQPVKDNEKTGLLSIGILSLCPRLVRY